MSSSEVKRDYWPTEVWRTAQPDDVGMDLGLLEPIETFAGEILPRVSGIVIIRQGYLVYERYFQGFGPHSYHTVNSVTKSVLSSLVGIALRRGELTSLNQELGDFFPEATAPDVDLRVSALQLRHLLGMTCGWAPDSRPDGQILAEFTVNADLVATTLRRPLAHGPGAHFWYDDLGTHLVSVLLSRASATSTAEFAREHLFEPLGVWNKDTPRFTGQFQPKGRHTFHRVGAWDEETGLPWKTDAAGCHIGALGLHLTLRDMAKFGYLYLNHGVWDGEQILTDEYIDESTREQSPGGAPFNAPYGYLWWIASGALDGGFIASGFGGQFIYVIPRLDLVVAIASGELRGGPAQIVNRFVIPSIR